MVAIEQKNTTLKDNILTENAEAFLGHLYQKFNARRLTLLQDRVQYQEELNKGKMPNFLKETRAIRENN